MFTLINNSNQVLKEKKLLNDYIKYLVKRLELDNCEFNVIVINNEEIRKINREYRNIDRETDVISFALEDEMDFKYENFRLLGDIYISLDKAYSQAMEYGHSRERELCFLITHGVLHLLGYDHMTPDDEKEMFTLQESLLQGYNMER